jgi:hypothetical protein
VLPPPTVNAYDRAPKNRRYFSPKFEKTIVLRANDLRRAARKMLLRGGRKSLEPAILLGRELRREYRNHYSFDVSI